MTASFDKDLTGVKYAWNPSDTRSEPQRREALFGFLFETYESSAWIPQSLFESNLATQAVVGDTDTIVRERLGLTVWPGNRRVRALGMAPDLTPNRPLRWTVNCVICHSAEIDGAAYLGAGTKRLDEKALSDTLKLLTAWRGRAVLSPESADDASAKNANDILNKHHHEKIDSLTRARSTAFAASHVELYMRPHDGRMPATSDVGRGDVKVPPLWHFVAKQPFGRWYCDGSYRGRAPLMASSMELEKDRSFDALRTIVLPRIRDQFTTVVQHFRPPPYPYPIDQDFSARGRALFYSSALACSKCHGEYDGKGNVRWTGMHVDVGTDRSRLEMVSARFMRAFSESPIAEEDRLVTSEGYAATPLTGVWANYPYLHNGSVPTLWHLLGPASERPRIFNVLAAHKFDRDRVGQPLLPEALTAPPSESELIRRFGSNRDWFHAGRIGCGNEGHDFWSRIRNDTDRWALIEYLKTL